MISDTIKKLSARDQIAWFLMDFCWLSTYVIPAVVLSVVTIILVVLSLFYYRGDKFNLISAITGLVWLIMNVSWMFGDLFGISWCLIVAKIFFAIGVIIFLYFNNKDEWFFWFKRNIIK